MSGFYQTTNENFGPWAARFLDDKFFTEAAELAGELIVYAAALKPPSTEPVALSFLVTDGKHWVGRYWGASEYFPDLHFNLCYYAPLAQLLETGGESFDPGMGSPHKVRRGFIPFPSESWHWGATKLSDKVFRYNFPRLNIQAQQEMDFMASGNFHGDP